MSVSAPIHSHISKVGTCPHGMPQGACPICNGMAGGNSTNKRDIPRNVGEMTYNQCAAIGAMLKAQKLAKAQTKAAQQARMNALSEFQKNISNTHARLVEFAKIISNNFPPIISKPVSFILTTVLGNVLKFVQNLPANIGNFIQTINQKFSEISDKLAAVYGEAKAAINEKVSKFLSNFKKKLKSLFFVFDTQEIDNEDKKIDEAKRTFELKNFIHKLYNNIKKQSEKDIEQNEH